MLSGNLLLVIQIIYCCAVLLQCVKKMLRDKVPNQSPVYFLPRLVSVLYLESTFFTINITVYCIVILKIILKNYLHAEVLQLD